MKTFRVTIDLDDGTARRVFVTTSAARAEDITDSLPLLGIDPSGLWPGMVGPPIVAIEEIEATGVFPAGLVVTPRAFRAAIPALE